MTTAWSQFTTWLLTDKKGLIGLGCGIGIVTSIVSSSLASLVATEWQKHYITEHQDDHTEIEIRRDGIVDGVQGLIGNTHLVRIKSLSDLTGCHILGKAEFLNPGGSVKDRVALEVINQAEEDGLLHPQTNSCIFEGTVGSTGISIATVARAKGYRAAIIMPDDVAAEKAQILELLGADVEKVRPVSIVSKQHYVNLARSRALAFGKTLIGPSEDPSKIDNFHQVRDDLVLTTDERPNPNDPDSFEHGARGFFADQFENLANLDAHYKGTGREIWNQTNGTVDAFVAGAGTGGTLAGVAKYLKEVGDSKIVLADPQGSGLFNRVKHGVLYNETEAEGTRRRHQVDTVVEGVGINRITRNFAQVQDIVDDAVQVTDAEAVAMSRHLVLHDGLFLGSSSAVNLSACVRYSRHLPKGSTIVTILCDSGTRHFSKFWSDEYLQVAGIPISSDISSLTS